MSWRRLRRISPAECATARLQQEKQGAQGKGEKGEPNHRRELESATIRYRLQPLKTRTVE